MQHAIRFDATVGEDRLVRLPAEVPLGPAEITVVVSGSPSTAQRPGIAALVGLLRSEGPAPDDDTVKRILDEAKSGRSGR